MCTWATLYLHDSGLRAPKPGSGGGIGDPGATLTAHLDGAAAADIRAAIRALADQVPDEARGCTVAVLLRRGTCAPDDRRPDPADLRYWSDIPPPTRRRVREFLADTGRELAASSIGLARELGGGLWALSRLLVANDPACGE